MITSIYRTKEEHDALYKNTPNPPPGSVHMAFEGVDIRSSDFSAADIERMLTFLNCFTFRNGKKVALYHQVAGNAFHFHIQFAKV